MLAAIVLLAAIVPVPFTWSSAPRGSVQPASVSGMGPVAPTPPASSTLPMPASLPLVPAVGSHPARDLPGVASVPAHLTGIATWYDWRPGEAAAGPALRRALGPDWRGQWVTVCTAAIGRSCVTVRLTDACWCPDRRGVPVVIDLDRASFGQLADPSIGVLLVTVSLVKLPPPPDTSTLPPAEDPLADPTLWAEALP